jgi:hypothetical protein
MFWVDLIFIIVFAALLSSLIGYGLGWRHPARADATGSAVLFMFFILFFIMLAANTWLQPWGPVVVGTPWLSLLVVGLVVCLLALAVAAPIRGAETPPAPGAAPPEKAVAGAVFGVFFWVLILVLLVAVGLSYAAQ